ncbi:MAG: hypothetical protein NZ455_03130 [Bacteroidia bacterium]|nr:hypothetical protein [Bacteroidia bacterium]MDW8348074.1 hypothetical protein [Bacteroidia bacterium]
MKKGILFVFAAFVVAVLSTSCAKKSDEDVPASQFTGVWIKAVVDTTGNGNTYQYTNAAPVGTFAGKAINIVAPNTSHPYMGIRIYTGVDSLAAVTTGEYPIDVLGNTSINFYYKPGASNLWTSALVAEPGDKIIITEIEVSQLDKKKRYIKGTFSGRVAVPSLSSGNIRTVTNGEFRALVGS